MIGSENLRHPLQPIRCKTKINHELVTRVFPRSRQFFFYFEFSLALNEIFFSRDWPLVLFVWHSIENRLNKYINKSLTSTCKCLHYRELLYWLGDSCLEANSTRVFYIGKERKISLFTKQFYTLFERHVIKFHTFLRVFPDLGGPSIHLLFPPLNLC